MYNIWSLMVCWISIQFECSNSHCKNTTASTPAGWNPYIPCPSDSKLLLFYVFRHYSLIFTVKYEKNMSLLCTFCFLKMKHIGPLIPKCLKLLTYVVTTAFMAHCLQLGRFAACHMHLSLLISCLPLHFYLSNKGKNAFRQMKHISVNLDLI